MSLSRADSEADDLTLSERAWELFLPLPDSISRIEWWGRCATLLAFISWTAVIARHANVREGDVGSPFLHLVLLPFHEAGHVIFRLFGHFMMVLGGTLGQLLMPLIVAGALLVQRRDAFGAALFFWLLGFSTLDMAVYMYDAFDPVLTLLNGATGAESDAHDWQNLFGDTGLLHYARGIGRFFGFVGGFMMLGGLGWAALAVAYQHGRIEKDAGP